MSAETRTRAKAPRAVSPSRRAAFLVLKGVGERKGEPASLLREERFLPLSSADRDLANEIVFGVLRWQGRLDFTIAHFARRAVDQIDTPLLLALRIGLYQIRHLDRVPARAAVDESVRLAQTFGAARGSGLVNAVLRSAVRQPELPSLPLRDDDPGRYLEVALSHPRWLAARYRKRLGLEAAEARCRKQNEPPPTYFRLTAGTESDSAIASLSAAGVAVTPVHDVPGCFRVVSGSVSETPLHREGRIFVQDAGSQLVPLLLDAGKSDRVLDVCAAPGGKATLMSERVPSGGIIAVDKRPRRVRLLRDLASKLGRANVYPVVADGRHLPFAGPFDRVLLDVPCTSLGTLRRNPDIKWRLSESDLSRLAPLQGELLREAARHVAPGGRLVYATCSTEPEENEDVVERFLAEEPRYRRLDAATSLPEPSRHFVDATGALRTLPERDDMDGYYAAILMRHESG